MYHIIIAQIFGGLSFPDITEALNHIYGEGTFREERVKGAYLRVLQILSTDEERDGYLMEKSFDSMFGGGPKVETLLIEVKESLMRASIVAPVPWKEYREREEYATFGSSGEWAEEQAQKEPVWEIDE